MSEYKLVPVELIEHVRHARRELTRHEVSPMHVRQRLAQKITDLLAAAPAVQGEPVGSGWMLFPKAAWDFLCGTGELNGFGFGDRPMGQPPFWWRLVIRKMLDSAPQPTEQPECGCCGQTVKCDDDCDAVALRRADQQPAACVGCGGSPGSDNSPCAVCGQQTAPDVAEEWGRAFLQIAVVLEAMTSIDSDERLSQMNAADVLGEAFVTLGRIRQMAAPDVAGLVEQHHRDSAELRRLCQARDEQRDGRLAALERAAKAEADVTHLVEALEEIENPIKAMRDRLQDGEHLDGFAAVQLAGDAEYLRSIARAALAPHRKQGGEA